MVATGKEVLERSHVVVWGTGENGVAELAGRLGRVGKIERVVRDAERAASLATSGKVDALVLEGPGCDAVLRAVGGGGDGIGVVLVCQRNELDGQSFGDSRGAFVARPFHDRELVAAVVQACVFTQLGRELRALRSKHPGDGDGQPAGAQTSLADMARAGGLASAAALQVQNAAGADAATLPVLRDARDAFERAYLQTVLVRARGNVTLASRMAGRNRTDFYELLRRRRISPSDFKK